MAVKKEYDSSSIKHYSGTAAIRQKPSMYVGGTDSSALWTIVREVADNSADENSAGRNSYVHIIEDKTDFWVLDHGGGIPVGTYVDTETGKKTSRNTLEVIFSEVHAGGKFDDEAYSNSRGCFTGDTKIRLLDGSITTFEQLYARWKQDQSLIPIASWDTVNDTYAFSNISHVQITKKTRHLVKVKLSNGDSVKVTPDHPFFVRRWGRIEKVEAQDLEEGDSLVASHLKLDKDGYFFDKKLGRVKGALHRKVAEYCYGSIPDKHQVHHKDGNRQNNIPNNLEVVTPKQHAEEHSKERSELSYSRIMADTKFRRINSEWFAALNQHAGTNRLRVKRKAINSGVRTLLSAQRISKSTYNKYRLHGSLSWRNLKNYFDSSEDFKFQVQAVFDYATQNRSLYKTCDDYLTNLSNNADAKNQRIINQHNSVKAALLVHIRKLQSYKGNLSDLTPEEFNGFGSYARLCKLTTLRSLKKHVLTGSDIKLHSDLSKEAQMRRAYAADARVSTKEYRSKLIHRFVLECKKLNAYDSDSYTRSKSNNAPHWGKALACIDLDFGLEGFSDVQDFIENFNFSVKSVKHLTLKEKVPVYDITVDDTHAFFIEPGVLVSNTHGVGVTATNALSEHFECWTFNKGKWWYVEFKQGKLITKTTERKPPKLPHGNSAPKLGTLIRFKPDYTIFDKAAKFEPKVAAQWCELTAYLQAGFTTQFTDKKGKTKTWCYKKGISEYLEKRITKLACATLGKPLVYNDKAMEIALSFTDCDGIELQGFTNGLLNPDGGSHVNSIFNALTKAIDQYKLKNQKFTSFDLREGIVGIINVKLSSPRFSSQTKEKLVDDRADKPVFDAALKAFDEFFKKNKTLAKKLCQRASELKSIKDQFKESKAVLKELSNTKKASGFASKHSRVNCSPDIREVFLVEGDSAGGTARKARNTNYQEILPLKGKILNVMKKADATKATQSDEILNILKAVGYDPSNKANPLANLRLNKLVLLSDADPDGPLRGNTRVLTLDGRNPTIKELAENWERDNKPFWVYARNMKGELVPAKACAPRITKVTRKLARLTLDNGKPIVCTPDHKWKLKAPNPNDPRIYWVGDFGFVATKDLRKGDRLDSCYFDYRTADAHRAKDPDLERAYQRILETGEMTHQWVMKHTEPEGYKRWKRKNKGVKGGAIHIDHIDDDALNNDPSNLQFLSKSDHGSKTMATNASNCNSTDWKRKALRAWHKSEAATQFKKESSERLTAYNVSQEHRDTVSRLNSEPYIIEAQVFGRCARLAKLLRKAGLAVNQKNWDIYTFAAANKKRGCLGLPLWDNMPYTVEELLTSNTKIKGRVLIARGGYKNDQQKFGNFLSLCDKTIDRHSKLDRDTYEETRQFKLETAGTRFYPKWETIRKHLGKTDSSLRSWYTEQRQNHRVVNIEFKVLEEPVPMYCLTVPEYGNFMVDDGDGNGVCSSNCHINTLILTLIAQYMPQLFDKGVVYIAKAAEYAVELKGATYYGETKKDLLSQLPKGASAPKDILHIKGWGEATPQMLRHLAFDPSTRILLQVQHAKKDEMHEFTLLMSDNVDYRRKLLGV